MTKMISTFAFSVFAATAAQLPPLVPDAPPLVPLLPPKLELPPLVPLAPLLLLFGSGKSSPTFPELPQARARQRSEGTTTKVLARRRLIGGDHDRRKDDP